jgi:hypothetical protein
MITYRAIVLQTIQALSPIASANTAGSCALTGTKMHYCLMQGLTRSLALLGKQVVCELGQFRM